MGEINDRESLGLHILQNKDLTILFNQLENTGLVLLTQHEPLKETLDKISAGHMSAEYLLLSKGIDPSDPIAFYRKFMKAEIPLDFCLHSLELHGLPVYVFKPLKVSDPGFLFRLLHPQISRVLSEIDATVTYPELLAALVDNLGISEGTAILRIHSLFRKGIVKEAVD